MLKVKILTGAIALVIASTAYSQVSRDSTMSQIKMSTYDKQSEYAGEGGNHVSSISGRGVTDGMKAYMEDLQKLENETVANLASTKGDLDSKVQANASTANHINHKVNANAATAFNASKELNKQLISTKYALKGVVPGFDMASSAVYNGNNTQHLTVKLAGSQVMSGHIHSSAKGMSAYDVDKAIAKDHANRAKIAWQNGSATLQITQKNKKYANSPTFTVKYRVKADIVITRINDYALKKTLKVNNVIFNPGDKVYLRHSGAGGDSLRIHVNGKAIGPTGTKVATNLSQGTETATIKMSPF